MPVSRHRAVSQPVRLIDIAQQAKVSRSVVSQVLLKTGGNIRVSDITADRIRKVAHDLNYRPNIVARTLAGKSSNMIGVLLDTHAPLSYYELLLHMERIAAEKGYRFMVAQAHDDADRFMAYAEDFACRGIDGAICISHRYNKGEQIARAYAQLKHVVFYHEPMAESKDMCFVQLDHAAGIRDATRYLLDQGRQRIGMLLLSTGSAPMKARLDGYESACSLADMQVDPELIRYIGKPTEVTPACLYGPVMELARTHRADAILATNDSIASMVIRLLVDAGLRVPQDVAVIGHDNLEWAELMYPRLTTIDPQNELVGGYMMQMLIDMIEGRQIQPDDRHRYVTPQLVVRESA